VDGTDFLAVPAQPGIHPSHVMEGWKADPSWLSCANCWEACMGHDPVPAMLRSPCLGGG
jgi:hypothetical protein